MPDEKSLTPAMRQYWEVKRKYPDCIVLFRMGDFYETFYDDAKIVARDLQIVLTARGKGEKRAPLAGIPYHSLEGYLKKLVEKGHKVVIVEQLEDPKKAKGLVKRGVVRVITPGTLYESSLIDEKRNNYLCSVYPYGNKIGLCFSDVSTGEFHITEINKDELETEIEKFKPSEVIVPEGISEEYLSKFKEILGDVKINHLEGYKFDSEQGLYLLKKHIGVTSYSSYGIEDKLLAQKVLAGTLSYLEYTLLGANVLIRKISYYTVSKFMVIDAITLRNLDLLVNQIDGTSRGTLLSVLDQTVTSMGSRLLKKWIAMPMRDRSTIEERLNNVSIFNKDPLFTEDLRQMLSHVGDIERMTTRINYRTIQPRELLHLRESLIAYKKIVEYLVKKGRDSTVFLKDFTTYNLDRLNSVADRIGQAIDDDAKSTLKDGGVIRKGYYDELDELREIVENTQEWIAKLEEKERERTGIKTLRVKYNKVFGYFIEIPRSQADKMPSNYIRKQTQVNTERYISPELKEMEVKILNAEERIKELEVSLYQKLVESLRNEKDLLYDLSSKIAELDVYQSLGKVAYQNGYVKPKISETDILEIKEGRHPVVERFVSQYIPNDVRFDNDTRIMIITGPNMAGKSTVMRQVALITIMAHIGSFVPAREAIIPLVDRVFTRVGARDDLSRGQSTFMMEMIESANILNNATENSLVIFDEIGRGTSTYDGMAIAWAIIEYLAEKIRCKTMFATHYHLLNLLSVKYPFVKNFNVAVKEDKEGVVFLHKLVSGGTDKSYGIHVARIAGLPAEVLEMAEEISKSLESNDFVHRETLVRLTTGQKSTSLKDDKQMTLTGWSTK